MTDVGDISQEQLDALEAKTAALETEKSESAVKLAEHEAIKAEWEVKEKEYQESANPNWAKARKSMDSMKAALEGKGVKIDEDGNVITNPQNIDVEKIRQDAVEAARGEIIGNRLEELLEQYDPESAKVVKHYYQKLTQGEGITLKNITKFVNQAERAAEIDSEKPLKKVTTYSGGQGPRVRQEGAVDEGKVKDLARLLDLPIDAKK